jgi:hypothetical protein
MKRIVFIVLFSVLITGCKTIQQITDTIKDTFNPPTSVHVLKPAKLNLKNIKTVVVARIGGNAGEEAKLVLLEHLNNTKRFNVVNRDDLRYSLRELSFGHSGVVDRRTAKKLGKLYGADALIVGKVSLNYRRSNSYEHYTDKEGKRHTTYTRKGIAEIEGALGLIELETGKYLSFENTNAKEEDNNRITNNHPDYPDQSLLEKKSLREGVLNFSSSITPYYQQAKLRFESSGTDKGETALKYIRANLWDDGLKLLSEDAKENPENISSWYNYGLVAQYMNELNAARTAFKNCLKLSSDKKYLDLIRPLEQREYELKLLKVQLPQKRF